MSSRSLTPAQALQKLKQGNAYGSHVLDLRIAKTSSDLLYCKAKWSSPNDSYVAGSIERGVSLAGNGTYNHRRNSNKIRRCHVLFVPYMKLIVKCS